jgi:hypothetical protein
MLLIKEWLRAATPSKDGKADGGGNPSEWQDTIMPLLQVGTHLIAASWIGFSSGFSGY